MRATAAAPVPAKKGRLSIVAKHIRRDIWIYLLLLPGLLYFIIFKYVPMWGVLIAFQDYNPFLGMLGSSWVGLQNFRDFLGSPNFLMLLRNTLVLAVYNLILYFPAPILLALMLNELANERFKRIIQTMIYVPHFISWVVVVGLCYVLFTPEGGLVNVILTRLGGQAVDWLWSEKAFPVFYTCQIIWKEVGWGTIIFLSALASVDLEMYEASYIDGATKLQRIWYITLPSIASTIVVMLILRMGKFLNTGFEHIYLLMNPLNRSVAEVFDTYVYTNGVTGGNFSYSTAVGLFKSLVGLILVFATDKIAKKCGEEGVY